MPNPSVLSAPKVQSGEMLWRKAALADIPDLLRLINHYASSGIMLPRTEFELSENIRDFTVASFGPRLAACGALHFYTPTSGEVRSLAVQPDLKALGIGRQLVDKLEQEALENGLHATFAFTYVPSFFRLLGYREVERGALPLKVWKDCLRCRKFQCCDEVAMLKALRPDPVLAKFPDPESELIQLPQQI